MRSPRALLLSLALMSANLVILLSPSPARAAFVGRNGWFVFSALSRNGSMQVWRQGTRGLVNVTGTAATPQVRHLDNYSPTWSPERGAHVAFVGAPRAGGGRGPGDIWMMSPWPGLKPTNLLTNLTHSAGSDDESPTWDFTGGHLAYSSAPVVSGQDRAADIWKTTWTGRNTENLTAGTASDDIQPAWSPRKHQIAFVSNRATRSGRKLGAGYGIWLMDSGDGRVIRELAPNATLPNWRSDGAKIAFVRGGDIWVMNADGSGQRHLIKDKAAETNPAWSPDGSRIAFQVAGGPAPAHGSRLGVMNADGTGRHTVLGMARFAGQSEPEWRPGCSVKPHRANGGWEIDGTPRADLICFDDRPMTIYGNGGDDSIYAGAGDDVVYAGPGNDIVLGGDGNDVLRGGPGSDYLEADAGGDRLYGGSGSDSNNAGDGSDHLFDRGPHSGDDGLFAGAGMDVCVGDPHPIDAYAQCEVMPTHQSR